MPTEAQKAWVAKTLAVRPSASAQRKPGNPVRIWLAAKEAMDARLNRLAAAIRTYNDPRFQAIADKGLFGVTQGATVALTKALIDYRTAPATGAAKVKAAAGTYRSLLSNNPQLALIDQNPFGVETGIGPMLARTLDDIEASL